MSNNTMPGGQQQQQQQQQQHRSPYNANHHSSAVLYHPSFTPTSDQHYQTQYQGPARHGEQPPYQPATNGSSGALPPLYRQTYYDPVDREMNPTWGGQPARDPVYNYAGEASHRASYSPAAAVVHADMRALIDPNVHHSDYAGARGHGEPISPTVAKVTPARRGGGAMSISALLTNAEEPASDGTPASVVQSSKRQSLDSSRHPSPEATRSIMRQTSSHKPPTYYRTGELDVADAELGGGSGKKPSSFRDFKYHDSMNLEDDDPEKSDSDLDDDQFMVERLQYMTNTRKRQIEVAEQEADKRKRRRTILQNQLHDQFDSTAKNSRDRARKKFYDDAMKQVMLREEEDEKERKKEQQRKRRREKAESEKRAKAEVAAKVACEAAERDAAEHYAKVEETKKRATDRAIQLELDGIIPSPFSDVQDSDGALPFMNEDDEGKPRKQRKKRILKEFKEIKETRKLEEPTKEEYVPHASKSYNQIYDQIWKEIARRDIPKVHRIQQNSHAVKSANLRKTAQLASKEAQRWKQRTNKNVKDTQARAKRCMREMMTFWKRNEREERDLRRRAEKEAIERAKREEEQREAKRQARKLNFLISQTELYSHFIGRKIKTDEVERSTDSVGVEATSEIPNQPVPAIGGPVGKPGASTTKFEDLDFDAEDDSALQQAAMNNAQNAIQAAQDRARAFNNQAEGDGKTDLANVNLDDGEMNFQNPTSLGDVEIEQPKMLNCELKEYQLKGLNWLCNLYEQGINGILADEMGLGKTVQSISVMAYLAEHHNIWGPFLVIAPASTLHNWEQEIRRFVPQFKAIPYWGNAKDRKVLRKFWDRNQPTYTRDSPFHVLITSYQLVVQDAQYFQRMRWQYMILDEAQAIKSSTSSRWKALLGFHCRNRLLLTGTPIQNSMQELWALLHFIMPSLFDSHDEFSEWFSKDIESHAQSNTQLNEAQLRRLHMILKPFMLRRVKKHVQKELGEKIEVDVFCDLTYRQRALYRGLRDKISILDIIEKAASGDDDNAATLMNLVMQFRKVCNHPDLFERADTRSPFSLTSWAETASFLREGSTIDVTYTARNLITYRVPSLIYRGSGRLDLPGNHSEAGSRRHLSSNKFNIWKPDYIKRSVCTEKNSAFSWLRFVDTSPGEASDAFHKSELDRSLSRRTRRQLSRYSATYDEQSWVPAHAMFLISELADRKPLSETTEEGYLASLLNVSSKVFRDAMMHRLEPMAHPSASAPPIQLYCINQGAVIEQDNLLFNERSRKIFYGPSTVEEKCLLENKIDLSLYPAPKTLPEPSSERADFAHIQVPSMRRFVSDSGKLAKLDSLLTDLKNGGHRVLLYFQMTRMMDLCEEYLTYRHHRYLRLDGSSKLEDRRDMVTAWQTQPEIFVFILSTRAGGLGINLTAADTVIFYDSDWNPTIDSQAMDRAHRLGQTKQVRVFRLITRGTIEERIRMRAQQKEEVQRVVIQGGDPGAAKNTIDFKGTREVATWLFDDEDNERLEKTLEAKEKEAEEAKSKGGARKGKRAKAPGAAAAVSEGTSKSFNIEDMYHEGEGRFDESGKPSEAATPAAPAIATGTKKRGPKPKGNKKKTTQERLNMIDGVGNNRDGDVDMGGV